MTTGSEALLPSLYSACPVETISPPVLHLMYQEEEALMDSAFLLTKVPISQGGTATTKPCTGFSRAQILLLSCGAPLVPVLYFLILGSSLCLCVCLPSS